MPVWRILSRTYIVLLIRLSVTVREGAAARGEKLKNFQYINFINIIIIFTVIIIMKNKLNKKGGIKATFIFKMKIQLFTS